MREDWQFPNRDGELLGWKLADAGIPRLLLVVGLGDAIGAFRLV